MASADCEPIIGAELSQSPQQGPGAKPLDRGQMGAQSFQAFAHLKKAQKFGLANFNTTWLAILFLRSFKSFGCTFVECGLTKMLHELRLKPALSIQQALVTACYTLLRSWSAFNIKFPSL